MVFSNSSTEIFEYSSFVVLSIKLRITFSLYSFLIFIAVSLDLITLLKNTSSGTVLLVIAGEVT
uniref:hypothetical protein n=1 Tax=Aliarcobacter sp. TaxID=2321116 RepID=UPI004047E294